MTHEDAFLQDILANPADDTPRLIYADWLDEHDQEERAEFIRVQIELVRCPRNPHGNCSYCGVMPERNRNNHRTGCRAGKLKGRERELLQRSECWPELALLLGTGALKGTHRPEAWSRGFIAHVTLTCADWMRHRESLLASTPLEQVTLTNVSRTQPGTTVVVKRGQLCLLTFGPGEAGIDLSFPELALR